MTRIIQATWNFVTNGRDPSGSHRLKQRFTPREAVKFNGSDQRVVAADHRILKTGGPQLRWITLLCDS
jgi:hypothetical protein